MKHVEKLKWHRFPTKDEDRKKKWASLVAKGRWEFVPTDNSRICSNHFPDGKPTNKNPNAVLYLTLDDYRRPKQINMRESPSKKRKASSCSPQQEKKQCSKIDEEDECSGNDNVNIAIAMQFAQIARESDVRFFTGFESTKSFKEYSTFWCQEPD